MMGTVSMVTMKYPYVYEDVDRHGNVRLYFWRKDSKKVRLREPLGSPEFIARYRELLGGGVPPARLTSATEQCAARGAGYARSTCGPINFADLIG